MCIRVSSFGQMQRRGANFNRTPTCSEYSVHFNLSTRHHRIMMSSYVLYRLLIEPPGGDSRPQRFCWLDSRPRGRRLASRARRALLVEGLWQEWTEPSTANALRFANFLNLSLHLRRGGGVVEELRAAVTGAFRLISISKL